MTLQMLDRKIVTDEQPLLPCICTCKHCKMLSKYFDSIRVKFKISSIKFFVLYDIPVNKSN